MDSKANGHRPAKTCMVPGCGRKVRCRGLCDACYWNARNRVRNGELNSLDDLVKLGFAEPTKHGPSILGKALVAAKAKKKTRSK